LDGNPSMKIHEIPPWHTIYNIISSMMFGLFTILFFALKTIHIPWMNLHKISFVDFQWGHG
jgi:hypothetical protein